MDLSWSKYTYFYGHDVVRALVVALVGAVSDEGFDMGSRSLDGIGNLLLINLEADLSTKVEVLMATYNGARYIEERLIPVKPVPLHVDLSGQRVNPGFGM